MAEQVVKIRGVVLLRNDNSHSPRIPWFPPVTTASHMLNSCAQLRQIGHYVQGQSH